MRTHCGLALVACVVLTLTACASPAPDDVATYQPQGEGGFDALLEGTLFREEGCTYFVDSAFSERWLPVFPAGTVSWEGDQLRVREQLLPLGEPVGLGGGESRGESDIPESCDPDLPRWQVN